MVEKKLSATGVVPNIAGATHAARDANFAEQALKRFARSVRTSAVLCPRRQTAMPSASATACVVMAACIDQPTTRRETRSSTTATRSGR